MESPQSWNLLTSSLAVARLADTSHTWAFLVVQRLVRDEQGDRETFAGIVQKVLDQGPITGPSEASRIASGLFNAGLSLPAGSTPDPDAKTAAARRDLLQSWHRA